MYGIVLENTKHPVNLGTALRTAYNFDARFIATIGKRYRRQSSDTMNAASTIPVLHFENWEEARQHWPQGWKPVGIELDEKATCLTEFVHPRNVVYVFGPEDGSLSNEAKAFCTELVKIPTQSCLNLAVAASVVMYDRTMKRGMRAAKAA